MTSKEVVSASGTVTEARASNDLNQITQNVVGSTTWLYTWIDGAGKNSGNLLRKKKSDDSEIWDYTWNEDNRLTRVVKTVSSVVTLDVAYTYDSLGRMLTRKLSTDTSPTTFDWDGWDLVREVDPAGVETIYYAPQGEITSFKRGNAVYQVHADALSSVRCATDGSGSAAASFSFDAWGDTTHALDPASIIHVRFIGGAGVRFDADTRLYFMRNRWYTPDYGSFLSRDLLRHSNRYTYALQNPVSKTDPRGLFVQVDPTLPPSDRAKLTRLLERVLITKLGRCIFEKLHARPDILIQLSLGKLADLDPNRLDFPGHTAISIQQLQPTPANPHHTYHLQGPVKITLDLNLATTHDWASEIPQFDTLLFHELSHAYQGVFHTSDVWRGWNLADAKVKFFGYTPNELYAQFLEDQYRQERGFANRLSPSATKFALSRYGPASDLGCGCNE